MTGADPYLQPNGTLRNKLGITGARELLQRETDRALLRAAVLESNLPRPPFTFETLKAIHHTLFQDVYDWAGEVRQTPLGKSHFEARNSPVTWFAPPGAVEARAVGVFESLAQSDSLAGRDRAEFVTGASELLIAVNNLHPFREGNGRAQRILLSAVARHAGHELAFDVVTRERMVAISIAGSAGDLSAAYRLFDEITVSRRAEALRKALTFLQRDSQLNWNDLYIATTEPRQHYSGQLVGVAGSDFMMRVVRPPQDWIAIGDIADLPEGARSGDSFTIEARHFASPRAVSRIPLPNHLPIPPRMPR